MDPVTLGAAKLDAKKRYTPLGLSLFRGLVPVSDRCTWQNANSSTATGSDFQQTQWRFRHVCSRPGRNIRLVFDGWDWDDGTKTETSWSNSASIRAGWEDGSGNIQPVYFAGQRDGTIPAGGRLISDPVPVILARGDVFYLRTLVTIANGQVIRFNAWAFPTYRTGEGREHGLTLTDKTLSGTIAFAGNTPQPGVNANMVLAEPTTIEPLVGISGDSIASGWNDGTSYPIDGGFVTRALAGVRGFVRVSGSGDQVVNFVNVTKSPRRRPLLAGATTVVDQYGINDIRLGSRTLSQIQADKLTHWTWLVAQGARVITTTLGPQSASTDAWTTLGNQTAAASDATRTGYNDWLRGGAPISGGVAVTVGTGGATLAGQAGHPLYSYFEVADTVESARNSGKWKVGGTAISDANITSGAAVLTTTSSTPFGAGDVGKWVVVAGAGSAGGALQAIVVTFTSSSSVTLGSNASTTVTNAVANLGGYTYDGVHPLGAGHALMAAAIDTTKFI